MVSLIPADTGKPTEKSDKAVARDGRCLWENPVYETVKFNREPKSGKILERKYHFVVGTVRDALKFSFTLLPSELFV